MALKGQARVGLGHALAVVDDLDRRTSRVDHGDIDVRGARVDRVLDKFLDDRGGSLDDLAGSYLVGNGIGKKLNNITHNVITSIETKQYTRG